MNQIALLNSGALGTNQSHAIGYIPHQYEMQEVASRLKQQGYRGAICGPSGCGKTILLQALGNELMEHGLTPLPLMMEPNQRGTLPKDWQRTIRNARHTDALLLDGFDLLSYWARLWVWFATMNAGAVVVTAKRKVVYSTLARPKPSVGLLEQLATQLRPADQRDLDYNAIFDQSSGNLHTAISLIQEQTDR